MRGAAKRMIRKLGQPIDVYNAAGGGGGRMMTDYDFDLEPDGTVRMIFEQRSQSRTVTNSSGSEVESDLEFRCVISDVGYDDEYGDESTGDPQIITAGDGAATILEDPNGNRFRVLEAFLEHSGVLALAVVED